MSCLELHIDLTTVLCKKVCTALWGVHEGLPFANTHLHTVLQHNLTPCTNKLYDDLFHKLLFVGSQIASWVGSLKDSQSCLWCSFMYAYSYT